MTDVFVLTNQNNEFLSKSKEWLSCGDSKTLFRTSHLDEAINEKVELTVKRPDLRIRSISVEQADNGKLFIEGEDCLKPAPKLKDEALPNDTQEPESSEVQNETQAALFESPSNTENA